MPHSVSTQFGQAIFLAVVGLSILNGAREERAVGAALLVQLLICSAMVSQHGFFHVYGPPLLDAVYLLAFVALAFSVDRRWTLWATAFQLLAVLTNGARLLDPSLHRWAYMTTAILWGYGVLAALLVGTLQIMIKRQGDRAPPKWGRLATLNRH